MRGEISPAAAVGIRPRQQFAHGGNTLARNARKVADIGSAVGFFRALERGAPYRALATSAALGLISAMKYRPEEEWPQHASALRKTMEEEFAAMAQGGDGN